MMPSITMTKEEMLEEKVKDLQAQLVTTEGERDSFKEQVGQLKKRTGQNNLTEEDTKRIFESKGIKVHDMRPGARAISTREP